MVNKKRLIVITLVLLVFILGAVLILFGLKRQQANNDSLKGSGSGEIIAVLEKPFYIEFASNPSTGYQWQADFDPKTVKLIDTTFSEAKDPNIIGGEIVQTFEFQPLVKGNTTVNFRYVRPWEENTSPLKTEEFMITVK